MQTKEKFVYSHLVRIGDQVVLSVDEDLKHYYHSKQPNGTVGLVVGFDRLISYKGRHQVFFWGSSGKFELNGSPFVKWSDGTTDKINPRCLCPIDVDIEERTRDTAYRTAFEAIVKLSELPGTLFYEGDIIKSNSIVNYDTFMITSIDYAKLEHTLERKYAPAYEVKPVTRQDNGSYLQVPNSSIFTIREMDISRISERGNYWNWEQDKFRLKFVDDKDMYQFYASLNLQDEYRRLKAPV